MKKPFKSDGCSAPFRWIKRIFEKKKSQICCCFHDVGYYYGKTGYDRLLENLNFFWCLRAHGHGVFAAAAYAGVHFCGMPIFWLKKIRQLYVV